MGAGLAGSTTKLYGNANVNQIQYGDKLQGLPPVTGRRDPYRIYKTKAGGNAPDRFRVFCVNQLGGIGMANKNSQFAPNADGLGWCPNRKNATRGDIGINKADRGHDAIRFQSRADLKAEFDIAKNNFFSFSDNTIMRLNQALKSLRDSLSARGILKQDELLVAMGNIETSDSDLKARAGITVTLDTNDTRFTQQDIKNIKFINSEISERHLWVNRPGNGKDGVSLGDHVLKMITISAAAELIVNGYGVGYDAYNPIPLDISIYHMHPDLDLQFFAAQRSNEGPTPAELVADLSLAEKEKGMAGFDKEQYTADKYSATLAANSVASIQSALETVKIADGPQVNHFFVTTA